MCGERRVVGGQGRAGNAVARGIGRAVAVELASLGADVEVMPRTIVPRSDSPGGSRAETAAVVESAAAELWPSMPTSCAVRIASGHRCDLRCLRPDRHILGNSATGAGPECLSRLLRY